MTQGGPNATPPPAQPATKRKLAEVLASIKCPHDTEPFCLGHLRQCSEAQAAFRTALASIGPESLQPDHDRAVLLFLKSYFHGLVAFPHINKYDDIMEPELVQSGSAAPFVHAGAQGAAAFGVPQQLDARCDTAAELSRLAAAALAAFYVYLNFTQVPGGLPPDETSVLLATMAINTCIDADRAAHIDAEIAALGVELSCKDVRWMMHAIRADVFGFLCSVAWLADDERRFREYGEQQRREYLHMVKVAPQLPLGYLQYTSLCCKAGQLGLALPFLRKGLDVCAQARDDFYAGQMLHLMACCLVLGEPPHGAAPPTWDVVSAARAAAEEKLAAARAWLPPEWRGTASTCLGSTTWQHVVEPLLQQQYGAQIADDQVIQQLPGSFEAKPPDSLPRGALVYTGEADGSRPT